MVLVRQEIGDVLRDFRQRKGRTLRQVAARASVALGYLSEVERGQKEASSEILASVADALDVPISVIMREVSDRLAVLEGVVIPDTVPVELLGEVNAPRATFGAAGFGSASFGSSNLPGSSTLASR
jgi:transcriptional regulator with XRE-family HTH domain